MERKGFYTVHAADDSGNPEIRIHGYIGQYEETNWKNFCADFSALASRGKPIKISINSNGGSTFDGMAIYDTIRNANVEVTGVVEGVAASMASVVFMACDKRLMNPNSRLMIHRPSMCVCGESDALRSNADLLDDEEKKLKKAVQQRTGQSASVVNSWFSPGVDKWITAEDCVKLALADGIVKSGKKLPSPPKNLFRPDKLKDLIDVYNTAIQPEEDSNTMKKPIIDVLNAYKVKHDLSESSTEAQFSTVVENAIKERDQRIADLEKKLSDQAEIQVKNLLDTAVTDGRITAEQRPAWEKILGKDFTSGSDALANLSPRLDVNDIIRKNALGQKAADGKGAEDPRATWTLRDWETKDPKGLLAKKTEDPDWYQSEFDKFYNNK